MSFFNPLTMEGMQSAHDVRDEDRFPSGSSGQTSFRSTLPSPSELTDVTMHAFTALSLHSKVLSDYTTTFSNVCAELERHAVELERQQRQFEQISTYLRDWRNILDEDLESIRQSLATMQSTSDLPVHDLNTLQTRLNHHHSCSQPSGRPFNEQHVQSVQTDGHPSFDPTLSYREHAHTLAPHTNAQSTLTIPSSRANTDSSAHDNVVLPSSEPYEQEAYGAGRKTASQKENRGSMRGSTFPEDVETTSNPKDNSSTDGTLAAQGRTSFELAATTVGSGASLQSGVQHVPRLHLQAVGGYPTNDVCRSDSERLRTLRTFASAGTTATLDDTSTSTATTTTSAATTASSVTVTSLDVSESTGIFMCRESGCPFTRCVRPQSPKNRSQNNVRRTIPPPRVPRERRQLHPVNAAASDAPESREQSLADGPSVHAEHPPVQKQTVSMQGLPPRTGAHEGRWLSGNEPHSRNLRGNLLGFSQSAGSDRYRTVFNDRTHGQLHDGSPHLFRTHRVLAVPGLPAADSWPHSPKQRTSHAALWQNGQPKSGSLDDRT